MATYVAPTKPENVIHTGFFKVETLRLFKDMKENLEEGRYCGARARRKLSCSEIEQAPDGEIVFNIAGKNGYYYGGYSYGYARSIWCKCKLDSQKIREELAWMLKQMVQMWLDKNLKYEGGSKVHWSRIDSTDLGSLFKSFRATVAAENSEFKPITVTDIYCIYELLRGRPNAAKKFAAERVDRWRGEQRDPIMTEMEVARREQIEMFKKDAADLENQLMRERDNAINDAAEKLCVAYRAKIDQVRKDFEHKINELSEQLNFMQSMA